MPTMLASGQSAQAPKGAFNGKRSWRRDSPGTEPKGTPLTMARTKKHVRSAEDRRAELEALHERIANEVEALHDSDAWQRFLDYARSFHRYSLNNLLLIASQRPDAHNVAGYRAWQALGRQVRKGETGIRILGGRSFTKTVENEHGEEEEHHGVRFFPVSVFDYSQTDPIDPEADNPAEIAPPLEGDDPHQIYQRAHDFITGHGWTVTREPMHGSMYGYATNDGTKHIAIRDDAAPAQAAKTLLHEIAHALMHNTDEHAAETQANYIHHRGRYETEAESVAYITAGALGLDTTDYSAGYLASWTHNDPDLIRETATRVLKTAHNLIDALTPQAQTDTHALAA